MPVFLSLPGSGRGRAKQLNPLGVSVIMIQANKYKGKGIMRKLLIYLNEYRKECILAPLFKLLEASFELIVPLVVAAIIELRHQTSLIFLRWEALWCCLH